MEAILERLHIDPRARRVTPVQTGAGDQEQVRFVEAAREGDRGAFEWLYERYAGLVHGILLARLPRQEVEDLVQEVFLRVHRRFRTLRDPAAFAPWIATIARNRANDFHRRAHPAEALPDDVAAPEEDTRQSLAVLDAIRGLPEAYRETLVLRLVEGMTGPEIARRTGMTHGSVRVNLHRGMSMLRERLRSALDG